MPRATILSFPSRKSVGQNVAVLESRPRCPAAPPRLALSGPVRGGLLATCEKNSPLHSGSGTDETLTQSSKRRSGTQAEGVAAETLRCHVSSLLAVLLLIQIPPRTRVALRLAAWACARWGVYKSRGSNAQEFYTLVNWSVP